MGRTRRTGFTVYTGPMFSGKTGRLVILLSEREHDGQKVQAFSPRKDTRTGEGRIAVQNNGPWFPATTVENSLDILGFVDEDTDVVAIDEAHLFDHHLVGVVWELIKNHEVFVAGLDLNFRVEGFNSVPELLALAEQVDKLTAICVVCGGVATLTQRIVNGEPAHYDDPVILVGGKEYYEPRCKHCHIVQPPRHMEE